MMDTQSMISLFDAIVILYGIYCIYSAKKMIETNRRNGIAGESFWFYEGVKKFPEFFSTYHK